MARAGVTSWGCMTQSTTAEGVPRECTHSGLAHQLVVAILWDEESLTGDHMDTEAHIWAAAGTATTGRKRKAPGASHPGLEVAVYEEAGLSGSQQAGEAGRAPGTMDLAEAGALTNNALLPFEMWLSTSAMHPLACEEAALGLSVLRQCCEAASGYRVAFLLSDTYTAVVRLLSGAHCL